MTSIYLLITIKKVSKKCFYAFSGVLVVSPAWLVRGKLAKDCRESMDDLDGSFYRELWCGLKVGNPFLVFSLLQRF